MDAPNGSSPMFVTLSGIMTLAKLGQRKNAFAPMLAIPLARLTLVRLVQLSKAASPMLVTLSGIVMLVRLPQARNAPNAMLVTGRPLTAVGMVTTQEGPEYAAMLAVPSAFVP